jgi:MoaA/NifB/PqqE/SkfB family radical SAM enzyme
MPDPADFPAILEIELTRRCSLACRMCQRQVVRAAAPERELDVRVVDEVLAQLGGRTPQVNLGGMGESLMHPGLPDLLARIKEHDPSIACGCNTNGLALGEETFEWLCDGRLDFLTISLNAPDEDGYRWLVGAEVYREVVGRARRFLARKGRGAKPLTTVQTFALPVFEGRNAAFVRTWGALADFAQVRAIGNWGGVVDLAPFGVGLPALGRCERPRLSLAIDLDGGYHRCCATFALVAPSATIFDEPIADYWRGSEATALREQMTSGRFPAASPCGACTGRAIPPNSLIERAAFGLPHRTAGEPRP